MQIFYLYYAPVYFTLSPGSNYYGIVAKLHCTLCHYGVSINKLKSFFGVF